MKNYGKMLIFVLLLGMFTSGVLLGMDLLTSDRIAANQEADLKSKILDAYGVSYTFNNINDLFAEHVDEENIDGLMFYIDKATGAISFIARGSGVWGPIEAVLSLESDFETILAIAVLQQEETPGLGGVVAESRYLATFVGIKMEVDITQNANPDSENEVDAITGATRTSDAFEIILNRAYAEHKAAWEGANS